MRISFAAALLAITFVCFSSTTGTAQTADFFWSEVGPNQGAFNSSNLYVFAGSGDRITLYLYYTTNGSLNSDLQVGALLDITSSDPGRLRFLSATVFEYDILINEFSIGNRWDFASGTLTEEMIDEWGAFAIFGYGISEDNNGRNGPFTDAGYDLSSDAFLFGQIEFELTGVGPVKIFTRPGDGQVVGEAFNCGQTALDPKFTTVTVGPLTPPEFGDVNQDGEVDLLDVQPFIDLLANGEYRYEADTNCDGDVNLLDVNGFIAILSGVGPSPLPLFGDVNRDENVDLLDVAPFVNTLTSSQYQIEADVNQDGVLDLLDVDLFASLVEQPTLGPSEGDCLLGDVNGDGVADLSDIAPFSQLILDGEFQCEADVNFDGAVNLLDVPCLFKVFPGG
ncbi:MAG: dockerin type I domain-containing protein [Planctomycetota bacterium]